MSCTLPDLLLFVRWVFWDRALNHWCRFCTLSRYVTTVYFSISMHSQYGSHLEFWNDKANCEDLDRLALAGWFSMCVSACLQSKGAKGPASSFLSLLNKLLRPQSSIIRDGKLDQCLSTTFPSGLAGASLWDVPDSYHAAHMKTFPLLWAASCACDAIGKMSLTLLLSVFAALWFLISTEASEIKTQPYLIHKMCTSLTAELSLVWMWLAPQGRAEISLSFHYLRTWQRFWSLTSCCDSLLSFQKNRSVCYPQPRWPRNVGRGFEGRTDCWQSG